MITDCEATLRSLVEEPSPGQHPGQQECSLRECKVGDVLLAMTAALSISICDALKQ